MKRSVGILLLVACLFFTGCALGKADIGEGEVKYRQSEADYTAPLAIDSPEGLAQYAANSYKAMIDGEANPKEEFSKLFEYAAEESRAAMQGVEERFVQEIRLSAQYFESQGRSIERYAYSETFYDGEDAASIYRIQIMNDGKLYYFKQDFVRENGTWKIKGDNVQDPFVLTGR